MPKPTEELELDLTPTEGSTEPDGPTGPEPQVEEPAADDIMSAVNAALDAEPDADDDGGVGDDAEGGEDKPEETEEEGEAPEGEKPAEKEPEPEPEKPEVKDEGKGEEKPSDEFGELPDDAKKETRERFDTLKGKFDDLHGEMETYKTQLEDVRGLNQQMVDVVRSTGANEEQFGMALQYLKMVNSKNPTDLQQAYDFLQNEVNSLGQALGVQTEGFDPLEAHADIKQAFENGDITKEYAMEIAKSRQQAQLSSGLRTQEQNQTREQQARESALRDLSALGLELAKDTHWDYKKPIVQSYTELVIKTEQDPSKWAGMIRDHAGRIPEPPAATTSTNPPRAPNPVRPGGAGPSGDRLTKEPGSPLEAMNMALDGS